MGKNRQQRRAEARALEKAQKVVAPTVANDISPSSGEPPWYERWRLAIQASETAIVIGLWAAGITAADMIFVSILLFAALIVGILAIAADPIRSPKMKIVLGIVLSLLMFGSYGLAYYRHETPAPEALLSSQIDEMRSIELFLSKSQDIPPAYGDSEENIRRVFDLNALVSYNMQLIKRQFVPSLITKAESEAIDEYFVDSVFLVDLRYVNTTTDPVSTAYKFSFIPGKIGGIKLSKAYLNATNQLKKFELSIQLPKDLTDKIKNLDTALSDNVNILTETINSQLQKNPNFVLYDQDSKSPYLGATTNLYWSKFIPLKPRADAIIASIRSYLNVRG